jgi:hypothetical protein
MKKKMRFHVRRGAVDINLGGTLSKKLKITIEVDPHNKKIFVIDNTGNVIEVAGIMVIGGMPKRSLLDEDYFYMFDWGSSTAAAWAYGRGYLMAHTSDQPRFNFLKNFYKKCAQEIAKLEAPRILDNLVREYKEQRTIDPEELLEKLEKRDKEKSTASKKILH